MKVLFFFLVASVAIFVGCAEMQKYLTPTVDETGVVVENSPLVQAAEGAAPHIPAPWNEIVLLAAMAAQNIFLGVKKLKQTTEKNREAIAEKVAAKVQNAPA